MRLLLPRFSIEPMPTMLRYISWIIRLLLVVLLMGFAFQNAEPVTLSYFGYSWRAPLVLIILTFFVIGVIAGLLAISTTLYSQRQKITSLKRAAKKADTARSATGVSPTTGLPTSYPGP
jgi:lipopolysaccharide assembly protein A